MKNLSKENFAYDVSAITGFTDQTSTEIMTKALIGGTTASIANVKLGIKGTQAIQILDNTPVFQAGGCGWSPSGTTTFSQINVTVCPERVNSSLCIDTLYDTYQSLMLSPGQTEETVPFAEQIAALNAKKIQQRVEQKLWQATVDGGDCFDGFKTLIMSGETGIAVSSSGTAFDNSKAYGTDGNPVTEIDKLINALDDNAQAREDLVVFMSFANYRLYVQALTKANFFVNYINGSTAIGGASSFEIWHPNANVKIIPTIGLNSSNQIVIGPAEYFIVAFDLLSDTDRLDMWYSKDNDEVRLRANYNYGAQIVKFGSTAYFATNGLS